MKAKWNLIAYDETHKAIFSCEIGEMTQEEAFIKAENIIKTNHVQWDSWKIVNP